MSECRMQITMNADDDDAIRILSLSLSLLLHLSITLTSCLSSSHPNNALIKLLIIWGKRFYHCDVSGRPAKIRIHWDPLLLHCQVRIIINFHFLNFLNLFSYQTSFFGTHSKHFRFCSFRPFLYHIF